MAQGYPYPLPTGLDGQDEAQVYQSGTGGEGGGNLTQRGYPLPTDPAIDRAAASRSINYASDADNAREMAGMQRGAAGGAYVAPGATDAANYAANTYGGSNFGFRDRLAANAADPSATQPGTQVRVNYGPAYGGQTITGTADANGRINSFTGGGAPGAAGMRQLSPTELAIQQTRTRIAQLKAGGGLAGLFMAQGATKHLDALHQQLIAEQAADVAQGRLGVEQGHLTLMQQQANPDIALKTARNAALAQGEAGRDLASSLVRAGEGRSPYDFIHGTGVGGETYAPASQAARGGSFRAYPPTPGMPGLDAPVFTPIRLRDQ